MTGKPVTIGEKCRGRQPNLVSHWADRPWILEINAWSWLSRLSLHYRDRITLDSVPDRVWNELSQTGADGVWLMGVWSRSKNGRIASLGNADIVAECRELLGDFSSDDIPGSPYSVGMYSVDPHLGGPDGLAEARRQLASRGMCLLLDFVPNHVAPDHPWIEEHPEYFISLDQHDQEGNPEQFFRAGNLAIAHGRDPYFPPWRDTAQLNAFNAGLRAAARDTVSDIAEQCDGVRCDMAMLVINRVFGQTWAGTAGEIPEVEYWPELICQVRQIHPGFLFIAEAYWDLESDLLQQGFDYCYDKRLYDRLVQGSADRIREHLAAPIGYQRHLLRFLENHDEPRAAAVFSLPRNRIAAVTLMTLPGAKLFQEGQFTGAKIRLNVHLGRCPEEPSDNDLEAFYLNLTRVVRDIDLRNGAWELCQMRGWSDNQSSHNLISWCWQVAVRKFIVVVNLSDYRSQALTILPWGDLAGRNWRIQNLLPVRDYGSRNGDELSRTGLYVDVDAQSFHLLELGLE